MISANEARLRSQSGKLYEEFYKTIEPAITKVSNDGGYNVTLFCSWRIADELLYKMTEELTRLGYDVQVDGREVAERMTCDNFGDRHVRISWETQKGDVYGID